MKKLDWIQLIALNLLMALCILLPFLPGPYDGLSLAISMEAQIIGYLGLLLVPLGILWVIQEIKKTADQSKPLNNWSSGYYYAIAAAIFCTFLSLFFILALLMSIGITAAVIALAIVTYCLYKTFFAIKELKYNSRKKFSATPLYLISIPLIAFAVSSFFVRPVSEYSRNYAIKQAQGVIAAIESYHHQTGNYPASIEHLYDIPKPSVLGVREFIYELNGDAYNLAFVQHQHVGATREVVMYNKNDEHNVKGHFAYYDAKQPHWKFYWLD